MNSSRNKARDYKISVVKRLFSLSGNQCAAPDCSNAVVSDKDDETIVGDICHIKSAKQGGARYDSSMDDDQRRNFDNLIVLCKNCHSVIDNKNNEGKYTVELLKKWKKDHESKFRAEHLQNAQFLGDVINAIVEASFNDELNDDGILPKAFAIEEKIKYNAVKRYRFLLEEYKVFGGKIAGIYNELDNRGVMKKEILLHRIRMIYLKVKGKYVENGDEMSQIREHADDIIEDVIEYIIEDLLGNVKLNQNYYSLCVDMIVIDAFMSCKILEEPKQDD